MKTVANVILIAAILAIAAVGCENNSGVESEGDGVDGMRIVPSAGYLPAGEDEVVFRVEGGIPPYTWEVADESLGSFAANAIRTESATYVRNGTAAGRNPIRVRDSHNAQADADGSWSATAIVVQD